MGEYLSYSLDSTHLRAEHMDKAYHQKKYHVIRALIGMVVGLIPCVLAGALVAVMR